MGADSLVRKESISRGGKMMELLPEVVDFNKEMVRWRHDIHQHPDADMHDLRTSSKVAELLRSFGFDEVIEQFGQVGVVGVLHQGDGSTMGLVAGISAQPIQESKDNPEYQSVIPKSMHAVGHDGETAILLGVAKYLAKTRQFSGTIVFIFCVREDSGLGAQAMIEDGLMQRYPMEMIYAMVNWPGLPVGDVALVSGPVMASVAELLIKIEGVAGHCGMSSNACSPVFAASEIINSLGNLIASSVEPGNPVSISVNSVHAGNSYSYIPEVAELMASVRFLKPEIESWLPGRVEELIEGIAEGYNVKALVSYRKVCDVAVNDQNAIRFARKIAVKMLGDDHVKEIMTPSMVGSDLATFLHEIPGAIVHVGNGDSAPLWSPNYDFDDKILPIGASFFSELAMAFLK